MGNIINNIEKRGGKEKNTVEKEIVVPIDIKITEEPQKGIEPKSEIMMLPSIFDELKKEMESINIYGVIKKNNENKIFYSYKSKNNSIGMEEKITIALRTIDYNIYVNFISDKEMKLLME